MIKNILIVFLCLGLISCATIHGKRMTLKELSQLKKGVTTQGEVVKLLGQPQTKTHTIKGRDFWVYTYRRSNSSISTYIPVLNVLKSATRVETQILQILFNDDKKYDAHAFIDNKKRLKTGIF